MAHDVAGLLVGMELLEPGFVVDVPAAGHAARLRLPGIDVDPRIDAAVDSALGGGTVGQRVRAAELARRPQRRARPH